MTEQDIAPLSGQESSWQSTLDAIIPAICAMKVIAVRGFQDDTAGAHGGTAFVVDAQRGILVTNRHVCTCGPARASATFVGSSAMEEVPVKIAYVDPMHDFALLKFDPKRLRQPPREIALDPSGCRVGEEIRIVGNDSMEKLQILAGTMARIDRNVPDLSGDYQDENTFYALASAGSRGGSSGSPVINRHGRVVALNAAAKEGTMHALFLPLQRVVRALAAVREGMFVPRGTLSTTFTYTSFPECIRLGVSDEFVQDTVLGTDQREGCTFTKASPPGGMLKVLRCLAGSEASTCLQPGDVLLELEGQPCVDFVELENVLDSSVDKSVKLLVCRGGQSVELQVKVQDLHGLVPHAFVELGLGIFHEVSYHTAQKWHIPQEGIYVAQAGFVFGENVQSESVILEVNGSRVKSLREFEEALVQIQDREYFSVTYMAHNNPKDRRQHQVFAKMHRAWCAFRVWRQDLVTRTWTPRNVSPSAAKPNEETEATETVEAPEVAQSSSAEAAAGPPPAKRQRRSSLSGPLAMLKNSLCSVVFRTAVQFDTAIVEEEEQSEETISRNGTGLVIDAKLGFVLTTRATVPQPLGDIEVTIGDTSRGASVWFVHPLHSFVILRVDPHPQGKPFGESAAFEDKNFELGDEVDFIGYDTVGHHFQTRTKVQSVRLGEFPHAKGWRQKNLEAVLLTDCPEQATGGVLCDPKGFVTAIYTVAQGTEDGQQVRLGFCIPTYVLQPLIDHVATLQDKPLTTPVVPSLEVEFAHAELQRLRRLPQRIRPPVPWLKRLGALGDTAVKVGAVAAAGPCDGRLNEGDLLVAVDGEAVGSVRDVDARLHDALVKVQSESSSSGEKGLLQVKLSVLRGGKEREVSVPVALLGNDGARRVLCWHGLVLQEMPRSAREAGPVPAGVYITRQMLGSPAEADSIEGEFVVAVDGKPTPSLDALLALDAGGKTAAEGAPLGERHLRVETADPCGRRFVTTLEPDPLFWGTFELAQDEKGAFSYRELDC